MTFGVAGLLKIAAQLGRSWFEAGLPTSLIDYGSVVNWLPYSPGIAGASNKYLRSLGNGRVFVSCA